VLEHGASPSRSAVLKEIDIPDRELETRPTPSHPALERSVGVVFFLFGFGTKQQDLGPGEVRTCPNCANTSQWWRVREFRQFTVFFVPLARWGRRHVEVCGICRTALEI
jgi:hypothetical protein